MCSSDLLVPAPDAAAKAVAALDPTGGLGFHEALAAVLTRLAGQPVDPQTLAAVELQSHLKLGLEILDAAGRCLVFGRDIAQIKREIRRQGGDQPQYPPAVIASGSAGAEFERSGLREFDFSVVPATVEVKRQGVRLALHPMLIDEGDSVRVTLVADEEAARRGWLEGCVRLWSLALSPVVRHAQKLLLADRDLMLLHQGIGSAQQLARDLVDRAVRRACWPMDAGIPLSKDAFEAARARGQAQLVPATERLGGQITAVLTEYRAARAELAALPEGCDAALVEDLRQHLSELVSEGFVARSPDPWLEGFVRYLKALRRRLAKLPSMRGAVADAQYEYLEARKRLRVAKQRAKEAGAETRLQAWRWHLEEYAVQLFAQDLRTRVPVSAKRLALLEAEAEAALRHP